MDMTAAVTFGMDAQTRALPSGRVVIPGFTSATPRDTPRTMPQDNVEIVEQIAAAFRAGDFDAIGRHFDQQIEWHEDPAFPEAGVYRGVKAVADYARQFRSEFERIRYDTLEVLDAGTHVIARMRVTGTGKSSGVGFETEAWWVYEFKDGKVVRCYSYLRRDAALKAAGLAKPMS